MEVAALPHPTIATTLDAIWASFHHGLRNQPDMVVADADNLEIENIGVDAIPAIADGEMITVKGRVTVRFVQRGAWCLTAGARPVS